jgi:hypothetical protein
VVAGQPGELTDEAVEVAEARSVDDQHGKVVTLPGHDASMVMTPITRSCCDVDAMAA